MANITKDGVPSLATPIPIPQLQVSEKLAGENIPAGSACNIRPDGKVWLASGAAANAQAVVHGFTFDKDVLAGQPISIHDFVRLHYGSGLTPGAKLYLSATPGMLSDTATTGGTTTIGYVVDDTKVYLRANAFGTA